MKRLFGFAPLAILVLAVGTVQAQTVVRPGFNIFTPDQDVEIGKQSALAAEKQLPTLSDGVTQRYLNALGSRLAARAPGPKFAYHFKVVNVSDINAFALPGGYVYVNRGLLQKVRTEGELAGVMAHEIAHVALRHPTNQASKAYLAQAGIGILGGLLGGREQSSTGQIMGAVGGFGLNTLFLKFSRTMESQADIVGSQIMARSGYDPMEMVHFFEFLGQQTGDPSKIAQFLSDHPAPANRVARVRQEAGLLGPVRLTAVTGNLRAIQTQLGRYPAAPTTAQLANGVSPTTTPPVGSSASGLSIEVPSAQYRVFQQSAGVYQLELPANWKAYVASTGYGVTIVPNGGYSTTTNGRQNISHGVIVNHYVPFEGTVDGQFSDPSGSLFGQTSLSEATSDLVRHLLEANPNLSLVRGSDRSVVVGGQPSMTVQLAGRSPSTGTAERVLVVAHQAQDEHVIYMLFIAPENEYAALKPTFDHMANSLRTNESATHN